MATTRIMPLHIGKGRTEGQAISDIIDYVANPQKTDHGKLITGYECDSRVADAEFLLAKRQYISATGRVRGTDDVIAYPDVFNSFSFCVCCYENKRICRPDDWLCRDCHGKCRTFKSRMGSVVSVDSHLFLGAG